MKWFGLYRPLMKLAHRFNWHYAPAHIETCSDWEPIHWCEWCGLRGRVQKSKIGESLTVRRPRDYAWFRRTLAESKPDLPAVAETWPSPKARFEEESFEDFGRKMLEYERNAANDTRVSFGAAGAGACPGIANALRPMPTDTHA